MTISNLILLTIFVTLYITRTIISGHLSVASPLPVYCSASSDQRINRPLRCPQQLASWVCGGISHTYSATCFIVCTSYHTRLILEPHQEIYCTAISHTRDKFRQGNGVWKEQVQRVVCLKNYTRLLSISDNVGCGWKISHSQWRGKGESP